MEGRRRQSRDNGNRVFRIADYGFSITFRAYLGEATQLDPVIAEYCLSHRVKDAAERAYARGEMIRQLEFFQSVFLDT